MGLIMLGEENTYIFTEEGTPFLIFKILVFIRQIKYNLDNHCQYICIPKLFYLCCLCDPLHHDHHK